MQVLIRGMQPLAKKKDKNYDGVLSRALKPTSQAADKFTSPCRVQIQENKMGLVWSSCSRAPLRILLFCFSTKRYYLVAWLCWILKTNVGTVALVCGGCWFIYLLWCMAVSATVVRGRQGVWQWLAKQSPVPYLQQPGLLVSHLLPRELH